MFIRFTSAITLSSKRIFYLFCCLTFLMLLHFLHTSGELLLFTVHTHTHARSLAHHHTPITQRMQTKQKQRQQRAREGRKTTKTKKNIQTPNANTGTNGLNKNGCEQAAKHSSVVVAAFFFKSVCQRMRARDTDSGHTTRFCCICTCETRTRLVAPNEMD